MADDTATATAPKRVQKQPDEWFRVKLTHPNHNGRTVFRSLSEKRARAWLEAHYPRGSEAHLVLPGGATQSYEAERAGERGADVEAWADFDPSEWTPTEQAPPPGQDEWADKEG
jgi:hypothetical protein